MAVGERGGTSGPAGQGSGGGEGATPFGRAQASAIRIRLDFVRDTFGEAAAHRYRAKASAALRALFDEPEQADAWADFRLFIEANVLIERLHGSGDLSVVRKGGRYAAQNNAGVWRALFAKGIDPPRFIDIADGLWRRHYDVGSLKRAEVSRDTVRVEIAKMPLPDRTHCVSVAGWVEGVFEFKPDTRVQVREQSCRASGDAKCELLLRWEPITPKP